MIHILEQARARFALRPGSKYHIYSLHTGSSPSNTAEGPKGEVFRCIERKTAEAHCFDLKFCVVDGLQGCCRDHSRQGEGLGPQRRRLTNSDFQESGLGLTGEFVEAQERPQHEHDKSYCCRAINCR